MDTQQKAILKKLLKEQCIGARHITEVNICKGSPRHTCGEMKKLDKLVKQNWIVKHPTVHGEAYALNRDRLGEIRALLESPSPFFC